MHDNQPTLDITHNIELNRFETTIEVDGTNYTGYISYNISDKTDDNKLVYDHTIVPKEWGGRGVGSTLVKHALEYAKAEGKKVVPACSFVEKYIERHNEYQFLVN